MVSVTTILPDDTNRDVIEAGETPDCLMSSVSTASSNADLSFADWMIVE